MKGFLIYPNQLFEKEISSYINNNDINYVYLIEDSLFFKDKERVENFNKLKLLLHRVSMKIFYDLLIKMKTNKIEFRYIDYNELSILESNNELNKLIKKDKIEKITCFNLYDHLLNKRLNKFCEKNKIELEIIPDSPYFILKDSEVKEYYNLVKNNKRLLQNSFYDYCRKKYDILMDKNGKFIGNKLSYDTENRLPYNPDVEIPDMISKNNKNKKKQQKYINEGIKYIEEKFNNNIGSLENYKYLAFSGEEANEYLDNFIKKRLIHFGDYQDAFSLKDIFLFHSNLSHIINIGLLRPLDVIKKIEEVYNKNTKIGLNNVEGFIRQILGWREYSRFLYEFYYDKLKYGNFMKSNNKLTNDWYDGTTGWSPIDITIKKAFNYGYLHHIERLMIMGNIMNLMKFHPDEVYKWFMEFAIDSYDWVMVNNVYGMILYADGGLTTTKPYIASDNYLVKMSKGQFKPDGKWDKDIKTLFYNYIGTAPSVESKGEKKNVFAVNGRTIQMYNLWQKKVRNNEDKKIEKDAKEIINRLSK
jgi:deoxyribodipyrimidine photolyase-related protein